MKEYTLVGVDGNAFAVMGYVLRAMRKTSFSTEEQEQYLKEAKSGDYNNLLCVSVDMLDECNNRLREQAFGRGRRLRG